MLELCKEALLLTHYRLFLYEVEPKLPKLSPNKTLVQMNMPQRPLRFRKKSALPGFGNDAINAPPLRKLRHGSSQLSKIPEEFSRTAAASKRFFP